MDENTVFSLYQGEKLVKTFMKIPKTGDSASLALYLALAVTAAALTVAVQKKRRHQL